MFVPMLKPLVTSSMVTGETPVMNRRSRLPDAVPAFSVAKKSRKKPLPEPSAGEREGEPLA